MNKPYILLSGAIKNIGDFLIFYRAKRLIETYVTDNIIEINRWESLQEKLELVNNSRGIIICGGPGFGKNMYPGTYKLVEDLNQITVPIHTIGVGWSGSPEHNPLDFDFSTKSYELMNKIHQNSEYYSCRDQITFDILNHLKFDKALMTGCPVWYDIESLNKPLQVKKEYKKIVFTTPANVFLTGQVIKFISLLKTKFPNSEVTVAFHRGINYDKYTSPRQVVAYNIIAAFAKLKGFKVKDVSYDLKKIDFYADCDLHIGYRVHAHLFFLSKRLPSYLISEDGRGIGMNKTLNLPNIVSWDKNMLSQCEDTIDNLLAGETKELEESIKDIDQNFAVMQKFLNYLKQQ